MPSSKRPRPEPWPETVTSQDVINHALARFGFLVSRWGLCFTMRDAAGMEEAASSIKEITRRMEVFRRITVRRWAASAPANFERGDANK